MLKKRNLSLVHIVLNPAYISPQTDQLFGGTCAAALSLHSGHGLHCLERTAVGCNYHMIETYILGVR